MRLEVYSIRDSKMAAFFQPFYTMNEQTAIRSINQCICDGDHPFSQDPQDYDLFYIGSFEDQTGKFELLDAPKHVTSLLNCQPQPITQLKEA